MDSKLFKINDSLKLFSSHIAHNKQVPLFYALGISTFSNLQTISLIIATTFNFQHDTSGPLIKSIAHILDYIKQIASIDPSNQPYVLFGIVAYFLFHGFLLILLILFEIYGKQLYRNTILRILASLYLLHSRILCSIINCLLVQVMSYQNICNRTIISPFVCSQIWFIISCFICVLNIGLALLQEFFIYRVTKNKDAYAIKNNSFHRIVLFQKILTIFLYSFITDTDLKTDILSVTNLVFSLLALSILYKKLPFYNMKVLKENTVTTTLALSTSLISVFGISGISPNALEIAWVFLSLLMVKICWASFNQLFNQILQGKADTPERAIHFIVLLKQNKYGYIPPISFEERCPHETLLINGTLLHKEASSKNIKRNKHEKAVYERIIYTQGILCLEKTLVRYPKSEVLLLFMAQVYLKKLKNVMKAISLAATVQNIGGRIWAKNSVDDFNIKLREVYRREFVLSNDEGKLNLITYFQCRDTANVVKSYMLKEIEKHIEFWKELRNDQVNVKSVVMLADQISVIYNMIMRKYQDNQYYDEYFANFLILFGIYLEVIQENSHEAKRFILKFMNLNHNALNNSLDVYSEKQAVVILPLETEKFGTILDASGSAQGVFDMTKQEIMGKSLEYLLPVFTVNQLFRMAKNSFGVRKPNDFLTSFGKTQGGSIFEVDIDMKFWPDIEKEIRVMVFFRRKTGSRPIMIVNSSGDIVECSAKLRRRFNLPNVQLSPIKLQDIAVEYEKVKMILNDNGQNENEPTEAGTGSIKNISLSDDNKQRLLSTDEVITKQREDTMKLPEKIAFLEAHDEKVDQEQYFLSFYPLRNTEEKVQLSYNVDIKPFPVGRENFKVLVLKRAQNRALSRASNITIAEVNAVSKQHVGSSEDEEDHLVNKITKIKWALKLKQGKGTHDQQHENTKPNQSSSPRVNMIHNMKPSKSQHLMSEIRKNNEFYFKMRGKQTERESNMSGDSSGKMLLVKALRSLFNGNSSYYSLRKMNIAIYLIVIFMACLGGIDVSMSASSAAEINTGIKIVNSAGLRLAQAMRAWQLATVFYTRYLKIRNGTIEPFKVELYEKGLEMMETNKRLQEISSQIKSDLLTRLYEKDVSLWDIRENTSFNNNKTDTFVSSNLLSSKMIFIGNTSLDYTLPVVLDEILYLINNTGNDYLISSEKLILVTQDMLGSVIQTNISGLQIILAVESVSVVILCLILLHAAKKVINSHQNLFKSLVKISSTQVEDRVRLLQRVEDILTQDIESRQFGLDALEILRIPVKDMPQSKIENQQRTKESKLSFRGLGLYLAKFIGVSLVIMQIVTVLFIVSLLESISKFQVFQKVSDQLHVTTRAEYRISMLVSAFYIEMMFQNTSSIFIRNLSPGSQLKDFVQQAGQINSDLSSAFYDMEKGLLTQELLEERICKYLSARVQDYCNIASNVGNRETGVYDVNMRFYLLEEYYTNLYFSDPNHDNARLFVDNYADNMRPLADTLEEAYFVLNSYIVSNFQEEKDSFMLKTTNMYYIIVVSLVFSLLVIQNVSINKLKSLDISQGHILKTVSYKILLENRAMKHYLSKHFVIKI